MLEKFRNVQGRSETTQSVEPVTVSKEDATCIGETISIEGSICGKGNLIIQGQLKGSIDLSDHQLTVGTKGNVEANIRAERVTISGKMKGDIEANGKVELTRSADFEGEIKAKSISVEDGAFMKAVIELERKQDKKVALKSRQTPQATTTEVKRDSV